MRNHQSTPPTFVAFAIAGGLLFILGGVLTTMSPNARIALVAASIAFAALGIYALVVLRRNNELVEALNEREAELGQQNASAAGLRSRMAYSVRGPLTSIVGFADRMVQEPDLNDEERRAMLVEVRSSAREVEQILAELSADDRNAPAATQVRGVVLVDEEVRSVIGTAPPSTAFEARLDPARAWGDTAQTRQIVRTLVNLATAQGHTAFQVTTESRSTAAVITVSVKGDILPREGIAVLLGEQAPAETDEELLVALHAVRDSATSMDATVGHTEVFGRSHLVLEFPLAPTNLKVQDAAPLPKREPVPREQRERELTYTSVAELRPERPTASIRFV